MKLKLAPIEKLKKFQGVTAARWSSSDQLIVASDEHTLVQWSVSSQSVVASSQLSNDVFPLDVRPVPHDVASSVSVGIGSSGGAGPQLVTTADGRLLLVNKTGHVDKNVKAHTGAVLVARWSQDGSALLTGGEDGAVRLWSRALLLRSTLAQLPCAVYAADWAPAPLIPTSTTVSPGADTQLVYAHAHNIVVKPLHANSKAISWKGHDGVILTLASNFTHSCILSGAEDRRYRVWSPGGQLLFSSSSSQHTAPISVAAWSRRGASLLLGCHGALRLCDARGTSHALLPLPPTAGTPLTADWCPQDARVAVTCSSGQVWIGHVVDIRLACGQYEAIVSDRTSVHLHDCIADTRELLEFQHYITMASFSHQHLIVATSAQCMVYSARNWNTPVILPLKYASLRLILQARSVFALFDGASVSVHSYTDGRTVNTPRWAGMQAAHALSASCVSLSDDWLAVRDSASHNIVHLVTIVEGVSSVRHAHSRAVSSNNPASAGSYTHSVGVQQLCLSQAATGVSGGGGSGGGGSGGAGSGGGGSGGAGSGGRLLALLDKTGDVYVLYVRMSAAATRLRPQLLAMMCSSLAWCSEADILCGVHDSRVCVWLCPRVAFVDKQLLSATVVVTESPHFGRGVAMVADFTGDSLRIRRADGVTVDVAVPAHTIHLHGCVYGDDNWSSAVALCRLTNSVVLWSCLAALSCVARRLDTAEVAFAAINMADKVDYLRHIKSLESVELRAAEMALFCGDIGEAEAILVRHNHISRAISAHMQLYNWNRALELATRYNTDVETVMTQRRRFLRRSGRHETSAPFLHKKKELRDARQNEQVDSPVENDEIGEI